MKPQGPTVSPSERCALHAPTHRLSVSWYGVPPAEAADASTISIPFQGHFAQQDVFFPPDAVKAFEARLKEGSAPHEVYWYNAHHAFGNENNDIYDPQATKLAWERSLAFLATHLA